jgi:hypothetical protein
LTRLGIIANDDEDNAPTLGDKKMIDNEERNRKELLDIVHVMVSAN